MEIELPIHHDRVYLKEEIRKVLKGDRIIAISQGDAVLLFDKGADPENLMKALKVIKAEIQLRKGEFVRADQLEK